MPNIIIDGINYHYSAKTPDSGEPKQAVVFVHGAGGSHAHWSHQVNQLGRHFLTIAVDLPGHGQSGGTSKASIEDYREFIHAFADRLLGFPFFLAGHSMGGGIALDYALNHPDSLAGLILIGTGARLRVLPAIIDAFKNGNIPENMPGFMYRPDTPETVLRAAEEEIKNTSPSVFYSDFVACDNFDVSKRLGDISVPALVLTGDKDVLTPVKYGKFLADNIKNAEFEIIEDAGHMPMLEQPGSLNALVKSFIEKCCQRFPEAGSR